MATVSFNSVKQTGCSLVFKPEGGEPEVNIGQIYFPYTFDPVEYGLDQNMIEGEYEFTCEGCVFTKVVNRPEPTTTTTTTSTTTTSTSTTTTTTLPLFACDNDGLVLTISDGLVGTTISTAARDTSFTYNGIALQVNITPSTYQSGYDLYGVSFTVPSGYSNSGQIIECDVPAVGITTTTSTTSTSTTSTSTTSTSTTSTSTTTTTTLATFTCEDVILNVSDGILNETVNATVNVGTIASITPSTYQIGSSIYTVGITVPSGYSNSGQIVQCTDTAIGEEGASAEGYCRFVFVEDVLEGFGTDKERYGLQWNHPTNGLSNSTFANMMGTTTVFNGMNGTVYGVCSTLGITQIWDSVSNSLVQTPLDVTILADGGVCTSELSCQYNNTQTFTCTDAGLNVSDGIYQQAVNATVSNGTIVSINPSVYTSVLARDYTVTIEVPAGYTNSGQTIECTDSAISETLDTFYLSGGQIRSDIFCDEPGYIMSQTVYTLGASTISGTLNKTLYTDPGLTNVFTTPGGSGLEYAIYDSKKVDGTYFNTLEVSPLNGITVIDGFVENVYQIDCSGGGSGTTTDPVNTETTTSSSDFVDKEAPTGGEF